MIGSCFYLKYKKLLAFVKNENAVLGLPMRLTVSIIIGTVVLISTVMGIVTIPLVFWLASM